MSDEFKQGDIVWVRLKGHTAWPAKIGVPTSAAQKKQAAAAASTAALPGIKGKVQMVTFFGRKEQIAFVTPKSLGVWGGGQHEANAKVTKTKGRDFVAALEEASKAASDAHVGASAGEKRKARVQEEEGGEGAAANSEHTTPRKSRRGGVAAKKGEGKAGAVVKKEAKEEVEGGGSEDEGLSEYEKLRKRNMSRNVEILESLDLPTIPVTAPAAPVRARGLGPNKRADPDAVAPRQRSLRIQGKDTEGLALPEGFREPMRFKPTMGEEEVVERKVGDLEIKDLKWVDRRYRDDEELQEKATHRVTALMERLDSISKGKWGAGKGVAEKDYRDMIGRLAVAEKDVAKVVPNRIFSLAVHPSESHVLVAAGDKWGNVGFFEPDHAEDDTCVTVTDMHTRPVTSLVFDKANPHRLLSGAYDSIVRVLDVKERKSVAVWDCDEDEYGMLCSTAFDYTRQQVLCGHAQGGVSLLDVRSSSTRAKPRHVALHAGKVRSIQVSPSDPNMICTGSHDCTVRLWDARKMTTANFLHEWRHGKGVNNVDWSPITGSCIVSTSTDDTLRILGGINDSKTTEKVIRHDNQTGRWLTPFRAVFDPKCDSAFVVGSMKNPREVEVFSTSGKGERIKRLTHDNFTTIASINAFHPSKNILVGGNSSGKVYVWR